MRRPHQRELALAGQGADDADGRQRQDARLERSRADREDQGLRQRRRARQASRASTTSSSATAAATCGPRGVEQTEALQLEARYFLDCVSSGQRPFNDGRAGLRVVRMLEAIQKSLKGGGVPVSLGACQQDAPSTVSEVFAPLELERTTMSTPVSRNHDAPLHRRASPPRTAWTASHSFSTKDSCRTCSSGSASGRSGRTDRSFLCPSETKGRQLDPRRPQGASAAVTRETDILGWVKWPNRRRCSLPRRSGDAGPAIQAVETIRARVCRELGRRLGAEAIADFSLGVPNLSRNRSPATSKSGRLVHADPILSIRTCRAKSVHVDFPTGSNARSTSSPASRFLVALAPLLLVVAAVGAAGRLQDPIPCSGSFESARWANPSRCSSSGRCTSIRR